MSEATSKARTKGAASGALGRDDSLLYLAALAVAGAGIWGVWFALESAPLAFLMTVCILCGFAVSLRMRRAKEPRLASLLCLAAAMGALLLLRMLGWEMITSALPYYAIMAEPTRLAAGGLGIVLVAVSFLLVSREMLTFCIVPVLAVFGLLATLLDPLVIIAFLFFLLSSIFLLTYEHLLSLKEALGLRLSAAQSRRLPQEQLLITAGYFLTVALVAVGITILLSAGLSRPRVEGLLAALERISQATPAKPPGSLGATGNTFGNAGADLRVGQGPVSLGQRPVFEVQANAPNLWRQRVYDLYTGNGWRVGEGEPSTRLVLAAGKARLGLLPQGSRLLEQTFHLALPIREGIPAAAQPIAVDFGPQAAPTTVAVDRFGCLESVNRFLPSGATYRVFSAVEDPSAVPARPPRLGDLERNRYLQVPWGARRVKDLVARLVPPGATPAEKVRILVGYLKSDEYRYTLQPKAVPADEDAVDFFLFQAQEGYCDLFASGFALMSRAAGLPSRLAVGYNEGEPQGTQGTFVVRESDAHAWVEVFLVDRGWVEVDPTPASQTDAARQNPAPQSLSAWRTTLRKYRLTLLFLFLCLLVSAGAAKALWLDPWRERRRWEKQMWPTLAGRIMVFYARMCRLLARHGRHRQPWQTPREFVGALSGGDGSRPDAPSAQMKDAAGPAEELTHLFVSSRYSDREPQPASVAAAESALLRLKQALRRSRGGWRQVLRDRLRRRPGG